MLDQTFVPLSFVPWTVGHRDEGDEGRKEKQDTGFQIYQILC